MYLRSLKTWLAYQVQLALNYLSICKTEAQHCSNAELKSYIIYSNIQMYITI